MRPAPEPFATERAADIWLVMQEAAMRQGGFDIGGGRVALRDYAARWIAERPHLAPSTVQRYEILVRLQIAPVLGDVDVIDITAPGVRAWRKGLIDSGCGKVTVAKAYRLLKAVLNTAVDDGLIPRNPCRIKGAGSERSPEREPPTMAQVFDIAAAVGDRWRALVLVAAFCALRWGELVALRRRNIDLDVMTLRVELSTAELRGHLTDGPPKSRAGRRTVVIPGVIALDLRRQLREWSQPGLDGRVFTSPTGGTLRRSNFNRQWTEAAAAIGRPDLHVHDLRHAGATWAAQGGATLRELMEHLGHASSAAAMTYQHAATNRGQKIADALSQQAHAVRSESELARKWHDTENDAGAS